MRWTIANKLLLALLLISLFILGMSATLTRWSFQRGFLDYVSEQDSGKLGQLTERLAGFYEKEGGWDALRRNPRRWPELVGGDDLLPRGPERGAPRPPPGRGFPPHDDPLQMLPRLSVFDADGSPVIGSPMADEGGQSVEIVLAGELIGELRIAPPARLTERVDLEFVRRQTRSIYLIALLVLGAAALASLLIARQMTRPIKSLTKGAHEMTAGRYDARITVTSNDELGALARDFNKLAATLASNRQARQRWLADISHELRTPLAILTGELQAIEDGVRRFDAATSRSLQAEVTRMTRLVGDLHELALSDEGGLSYSRQVLDLAAYLREALAEEEARIAEAGLRLELEIAEGELPVRADPARLRQLFGNLLQNTLRYTEVPGVLRVSCRAVGQVARLEFSDSAPGVPAEAIAHVFDRLYRVEGSRSRATGGAGLGLSICQAIVAAHDGTISASASNLGGLTISVTLPLLGGDEVAHG